MSDQPKLLSIAKLASDFGIRPLKKFGQNFIFDESLCDRIVKASGLTEGEEAIEVGPGPAGLTRSILKCSPSTLHVIEMDERCIPLLDEIKKHYPQLRITNNDGLKIQVSDLLLSSKTRMISNLPYNVGTKLVLNWFKELDSISSITVMLQREVVERIVARPDSKAYGRLSIIAQICMEAKKCFDVSPKAFYPEPKVWSSIVHMVPKENRPERQVIEILEQITAFAFSGRRKMIKASLKGLAKKYNIELSDIFAALGIDPTLRAENLSPLHYLSIAEYLHTRTHR